MPIERRPIAKLKPYRANPRTHPQGQIDKLALLIQKYGFHDSHAVAVDEDNVVIWGHGRIEAARQAGLKEVPVEVLTGLSEADKTALRIADNGIAEQSDWDLELLAKELESLNQDGYSLELLALDDSLLEELGGVFDPGEDQPPTDDEWAATLGGLPEGDRAPFQQMTFTLHDDQVEIVKAAIEVAKGMGDFDSPNENSNGNALARVCEFFQDDHGHS